jgi:APA family basic amino acid/polyamine antiporter
VDTPYITSHKLGTSANNSERARLVNESTLKRTITLPLLIFYGVGTMVGGGFYALMGKVAGIAGMATPLAFALTGALALLTALSFAALSSRYPASMASARYVYEGYKSIRLSKLTGWLLVRVRQITDGGPRIHIGRFRTGIMRFPG